ncbi:P-loop containing nucleoside triphosphate hydrolase protein [Cantharellus anzutake]|uniref:P-loop containing nucleoside triphosphate hydrolase protein n=1 Tax=Cantharellus anzutake TaxID=1750568 RepID=UPI00190673F3|nr:P-loop containing nucleoside triphosphate hydrolase protein [Cantharellus anzutake]KAF8342035.1 P-loop containing nucleoside triphosphate hydrolase protein [Cantharellus anzutake]
MDGQSLDAKVVVMGNSAVGKTSLVQRYTEDRFTPASTTSTTGAFFVTKKLFVDGLKVRLQLWDTAGQERFRSMAPMYYRGASAAILVYDVTDLSSFDDVRIWIDELKHHHKPPLIIYVVGSKADLADKGERAVTLEYARKSLHTWYPPTPKPGPNSSRISNSTLKASSYIRPRFISLTTSLSTPAMTPLTSPPKDSHSSNGSPSSAPPLGRSRSARVSPAPSRPPEALPQPKRLLAATHNRRWSDAMMGDDAIREQNESDDPSTGISGSGRSYDTDVFDDSTSLEEIEELYPLEKGMELFEVSSKDDEGVQALFAHLIDSIIQRRDIIEGERLARGRNSVMLDGGTGMRGDGEDGDDATLPDPRRSGGWSCCST